MTSAAEAGGARVAEVLVGKEALVKPGWERLAGWWLMGTSGLLFSMIALGGYTRLSGSGLSMTDWRIEGRSLPKTEELWEQEFEEYKKYPEYLRLHNGTMTLEQFKKIYFVEWFHRMWGRGAGAFFAVPLVLFAAGGIIRKPFLLRLTGLLGLGISQGFVGWWMVRSGFDPPETHTPMQGPNQRPRVSAYRLASHWTAALTIYIGTFWYALHMLRPTPEMAHVSAEAIRASKRCRLLALPATAALALALLTGPFVAGNDAGRAFNTWPKMNYDWVPAEWLQAVRDPLANPRVWFEDTAVVQFNHRCVAYASVGTTVLLTAYGMSQPLYPGAAWAVRLLPWAVTGQAALGVATLLLYVPIEFGVAHQAGGIAVLSVLLTVLHALRVPPAGVAALAAAGASAAAA